MLSRLNRKKSSTTAPAHPKPPFKDWRNREDPGLSRITPSGPERLPQRKRRLKMLEIFSLVAVISLIVGVDIYIFGINKRLNALENEFSEVKTWAFPASLLEGKYASLNARVRALTESFSGLDARLTSLAAQQQPVTLETRVADHALMVATEANIPSEAPAAGIAQPRDSTTPDTVETAGRVNRTEEQTPATVFTPVVETQPDVQRGKSPDDNSLALHSVEEIPIKESSKEPPPPAKESSKEPPTPAADVHPPKTSPREGRWVINLLSDPNKALAERFADRARERGIPVEQARSEVKGRVFWRVQITGFETSKDARAHADEVKAKLHLQDVWIFKQQG